MLLLTLGLILLPMLAGGAAYFVKERSWSIAGAGASAELIVTALLLSHVGEKLDLPGVCGLGVSFSNTGLQVWLCILAGFLWMVSTLFAGKYLENDRNNPRFYLFLLLTEGAIMGVFLSADLFTTLVFFEMMSFASWPLVLHRGTREAVKAAGSYLAYAVIGGMVSLMGLFLLYNALGTLRYEELTGAVAAYEGSFDAIFIPGCLALVTFAAKVCMFPLHTWLPGSYAEAPAPATALLSGIITKAGMFGIFGLTAKLFYGSFLWGDLILHFGIATALVGGVLALCSTNLKTTIAYSSMSQIGFILVGTGMTDLLGEENTMAVWGSVLHLTNHSLIKLVLLLAAGVVVYHVGDLDYNKVRGFGRGKPALAFAFAMPALGVMGVPMWNGYISKTLIHEAIVEYIEKLELLSQPTLHYRLIEWLFLLAGGMTVGYMTKLFVCIFIEHNPNGHVQKRYDSLNGSYMPLLWKVLLCGGAALMPILGLLPHQTQEAIAKLGQGFFTEKAQELSVHYFSLGNLRGACISLAFGAAFYVFFVGTLVRRKLGYHNPWPRILNLEKRVYQPVLMVVLPFIGALCARFAASIFEWCVKACNKLLFFRYDRYVHPEEDSYFARYKSDDPGVRGFRSQIAYALALFSAGFVCVVVYLLLRNFVLV